VNHRIPDCPVFEWSFSDTICVRFSNGFGGHFVKKPFENRTKPDKKGTKPDKKSGFRMVGPFEI
jgi:hypothetical protein